MEGQLFQQPPKAESEAVKTEAAAAPAASAPHIDAAPAVFRLDKKFQDDVHGQIPLSTLEQDVIDTPEFQRLFRVGQLGFVDLVFPTANHTRGAHSIGVCHLAGRLMDRLEHNHESRPNLAVVPFPTSERVLIRLAGLLHDIPHAPFSHDIETKKHIIITNADANEKDQGRVEVWSHYGVYKKHDDWDKNPTLYQLLFDTRRSVLARVLRTRSRPFWQLMCNEASAPRQGSHPSVPSLVDAIRETKAWTKNVEQDILPQLLFHLLVYEKPGESGPIKIAKGFAPNARDFTADPVESWGLGPDPKRWEDLHKAWYQPYRHDIIGNTLSADLLDYLQRDSKRMGLREKLDLNILNFYVIAPTKDGSDQFRCAIDVVDRKRGPLRNELLTDLFRLLDVRYEIHEKGVMHRMVQAANAMLSRCLLLLGQDRLPSPEQIIGLRVADSTCALSGDDQFLNGLLTKAQHDPRRPDAGHVLRKLAERRLYRPLMVIPGDFIQFIFPQKFDRQCSSKEIEEIARRVAALIASPMFAPFFMFVSYVVERVLQHDERFASQEKLLAWMTQLQNNTAELEKAQKLLPRSIIIWASPYKQLYKDPALAIQTPQGLFTVETIPDEEKLDKAFRERVQSAIEHADRNYSGIWKLYVFVSDGLFYTGTKSKLIPGHPCNRPPGGAHPHLKCLEEAQRFLVAAIYTAADYWGIKGFENRTPCPIDKAMTPEMFKDILSRFVTNFPEFPLEARLKRLNLDMYLHEESGGDSDDLEKCRDIRYKFDEPIDIADLTSHSDPSTRELATLLKDCAAPSQLPDSEFDELLLRYRRPATKSRLDALRSAWLEKDTAQAARLGPDQKGREAMPILFAEDEHQLTRSGKQSSKSPRRSCLALPWANELSVNSR